MAKGKVEKLKKAIYSEVTKVDLAHFGIKLFIYRSRFFSSFMVRCASSQIVRIRGGATTYLKSSKLQFTPPCNEESLMPFAHEASIRTFRFAR